MKKILILMLALATITLFINRIYAMGILQGEADYIPMPKTNIGLTAIDQLGVRTTVEHGSVEGKDYISGYSGMILNVIPFINIKSINFTSTSIDTAKLSPVILDKLDNNPLIAIIHLKDAGVITLTVNGSSMCYGKTPFGYVRVKLSSLDVIEGIKQLKKDASR